MLVYIITIAVIFICSLTVAGLIIRSYRQKMLNLYDDILQKLDRAIAGKKLNTTYDESMDSAISERLNRIAEISSAQRELAEEERDIIKSLISDISHQIRTPLSNITLYTGLLKEELTDSKAKMLSDKVEQNAGKLDFFMKELIKSSYAEQELIAVHPQSTPTDELIKKACQVTELAALKKNIKIDCTYNGYTCLADLKWTEEALANIIDNAIKYSPSGSTVFINSILYESFVCIEVKDSGIGIPEEEQGKIFQRFYRGTNILADQGFGIGLYLAREVVTRQHGYIKVASSLSEGTTVKLFLLRQAP